MDRSLLLDGKQWRSKMASTAATNFQRTSGHLLVVSFFVLPQIWEMGRRYGLQTQSDFFSVRYGV